jgi:hypothetical protein
METVEASEKYKIRHKDTQLTLSKGPLNIKAKGGRYKEARLSRELDIAFCSESQTADCLASSSKLRKATVELGRWL